MKTTICIVTFRRPEGLLRLLNGLNSLHFDSSDPDLDVIVVDNDPERGAEEPCSRAGPGFRWPLRYSTEPRRGIAHARNRALALVDPRSEWVAFIDDDEVPDPRWLSELLRVQRETDADVVAGPVVPFFTEPVAAWVEAGDFFQPSRFADGSPIPHAFTGNVLLRASLLRDPRLRPAFAEHFALSGGEDRHFFQRVRLAGYRLCWADRAVATEWVPAVRANARWLIRRQLRVGNALAFIESELEPERRLRRWARTCRDIVRTTLSLPGARLRGQVSWVRARQRLAQGLGMLWGLFGGRIEEYRDVPAR